MKPPPFDYYDPRTLSEAIDLLGRLDNAKVLAGGQSLMPMLNMRFVLPDHVIDLNRIEELFGIREVSGALEVGAMTRQRDLEFSDVVRDRCPLIHEAILQVGHRQTRNRGTVGGSLCHLDPAAELATLAAALDATLTIAGPSRSREVPFAEFTLGYMMPALETNELLVAVRFPLWSRGHGHAFVEFARRHGDFAVVSAAAMVEAESSGRITRASLAIGGIAAAPVRQAEIETALVGQIPSEVMLRDLCESCRRLEAIDDIHAPAAYRRHLATVLSYRALAKACARLAGRPDTPPARESIRRSA